jgi:hypothetical protein
MFQVTQIIRFLPERGLRFRKLGFCGHEIFDIDSDLQCRVLVARINALTRSRRSAGRRPQLSAMRKGAEQAQIVVTTHYNEVEVLS